MELTENGSKIQRTQKTESRKQIAHSKAKLLSCTEFSNEEIKMATSLKKKKKRKKFVIINNRTIHIKATLILCHADRTTKINKMIDTCWRGQGGRGALIHCWWNCKCVQPLWKSVW